MNIKELLNYVDNPLNDNKSMEKLLKAYANTNIKEEYYSKLIHSFKKDENELNINIRYIGNYPLLFAVMILSVLPILIVYIIFQDAMLNATLGGGIKE